MEIVPYHCPLPPDCPLLPVLAWSLLPWEPLGSAISQLKDYPLHSRSTLDVMQPWGQGPLVEVSTLTDPNMHSVTVKYFDNHH